MELHPFGRRGRDKREVWDKLYAHQNEDIVRLTPEELKAKMAAKEAR